MPKFLSFKLRCPHDQIEQRWREPEPMLKGDVPAGMEQYNKPITMGEDCGHTFSWCRVLGHNVQDGYDGSNKR